MKIKLALAALLLPAFVFAQSGQGGQTNPGYQGTMNGSQGGAPGAKAPGGSNQNQGNPGYQGTMSGSKGGAMGSQAPGNNNQIAPGPIPGTNPNGPQPAATR